MKLLAALLCCAIALVAACEGSSPPTASEPPPADTPTTVAPHIDTSDPRYKDAAAEIEEEPYDFSP